MTKAIWRWLGRGIKWFGILLLGGILALVAINSFDQEPTPEARTLLAIPPNPYPPEQNLYLALLGIDAPGGESPIAYAQAKLAGYESHLAANLKDPRLAAADAGKKDPRALAFRGDADQFRPLTASVWTEVDGREADIERLLKDNGELYRRYLALHGLPGYHDTATPSPYAPLAYSPPALRALFLADFAVRMKSGNAARQQQALADLEDDIHTWRTMLIGDGPLVAKMVAISYLQGDFLLLADMTADNGIDSPGIAAQLDRITTPFDLGDWKIAKAFGHEFRATAPLWDHVDGNMVESWAAAEKEDGEPSKWWNQYQKRLGLHFYQKHATENFSANAMLALIRMADADPKDLGAARAAYSRWTHENLDFSFVPCAYNPIGKILVAIGTPAFEGYPLRAYDAAALQRLVRLGYEIRRQHIAATDIPSFMQRHPELATHPVDGRAFSWDAAKGEIALAPLGKPPGDRRFSIPVWRGAAAAPQPGP